MIAAILCAMALVDGALSGFRSWAGRDGRVVKRQWRMRSSALGAVAAIIALVAIGLVAVVVMVTTDADYAALDRAGTRMVWVFVPFCAAVALGFVGYFLATVEGQALSTVMVLGPATMARPFIILAGAVAAAWGSGPAVAVVAFVAAAAMLAVEPILGRYWAAQLRGHPFEA